jgi:hypothetical protein
MILVSMSVSGDFPHTGDINTARGALLTHSLSRHGMATLKLLLMPVAVLLASKYTHCQPALNCLSLNYFHRFFRDVMPDGNLVSVNRPFGCIVEFNAKHWKQRQLLGFRYVPAVTIVLLTYCILILCSFHVGRCVSNSILSYFSCGSLHCIVANVNFSNARPCM